MGKGKGVKICVTVKGNRAVSLEGKVGDGKGKWDGNG